MQYSLRRDVLLSHMFIIMFIRVAFLVLVCVLHLSGIPFKLLQAIAVWGLKQILKILEVQTNKQSHRKRMHVGMHYFLYVDTQGFPSIWNLTCYFWPPSPYLYGRHKLMAFK